MSGQRIHHSSPSEGERLRDESWRLINTAHLDYSPKFLVSAAGEAGDGLVRTPMGYYRLAEDMRDGTRVLLHSYERDLLTGVRQADGQVRPGEKAWQGIYGVTARKGVRGAIFRDDMGHDIRFLERCFQSDLNLHAEEVTKPGGMRAVRLSNGHASFGIYEGADGRWTVRLYHNLRKSWDRAGRFVLAQEQAPGGLKGKFAAVSRTLKTCGSYDEAFQYVRRFWRNESMRLFKGKSGLADPSKYKGWQKIRVRLLSTAMRFREEKMYRDWRRAIAVAVGVGFLSTVVSGVPLVGAAAGLGVGFFWATAGKSIEAALTAFEDRRTSETDRMELESLRPYFERNAIERYLKPCESNMRRYRRKIGADALPHLRFLDYDEADMNYDDGPVVPLSDEMRAFERLSTAPYRYFGALFDAGHADRGLLACIFPNGMQSVIQVDRDTRATRHYVSYRKKFDILEADAGQSMHPRLGDLPGPGPVHKITHRKGADFRYAAMDGEGCIADLMHKVGREAGDMRVFGMTLRSLFNVGAGTAIAPRAIEGAPVYQQGAAPRL